MNIQTLSIIVDNHAGVLVRVAGLFSRRGYNIVSLAVGETQDPEISRITVRVDAGLPKLEQIIEQVRKLACVRDIFMLDPDASVSRELVFIKVSADKAVRGEIIELASVFRARIIDVSPAAITLEMTGEADKLAAFTTMLKEYGVIELARTGVLAMARGS